MSDFVFILIVLAFIAAWLTSPRRPHNKRQAPKRSKSHAGRERATCLRVIDGDTIEVLLNGDVQRVRYIGVNAPELDQRGYAAALDYNRRLVEGKAITMERDRTDKDKYDRLLRYVWVNGLFVNAEMVRSGKAKMMAIKPNTSRIEEIAGNYF